jgi:glycosyltransferase involved in cell wall biosynthesis
VKLVFFNRFFFPDTSATSQMLTDLALDLARTGSDVHVVASHAEGENARTEAMRGLTVHRVAAAAGGPHGLAWRALAYLAYLRGARRAAYRLLRVGDLAITLTDPPLLSAAIAPVAARRGAKLVAWLQDLFPEVAREYGIPGTGRIGGAPLRRLRDRSLAGAHAVVVIGDTMAERVRALGCVDAARLQVIHNWSDGRAIMPVDPTSNALRRAWGLDGRFVVGYSGNLGRVHEFGTLLDAAARLSGEPDVVVLIVGRGPRLAEAKQRAARDRLANLRFEPHQNRAHLAESLGAADLHISILPPAFEGLVVPSKIYGIMAAGRPTVFIGSITGETARILAQAGAGLTVATGDSAALAAAILRLRDDFRERAAMGDRARAAFEARYDMPIALRKWRSVLHI